MKALYDVAGAVVVAAGIGLVALMAADQKGRDILVAVTACAIWGKALVLLACGVASHLYGGRA